MDFPRINWFIVLIIWEKITMVKRWQNTIGLQNWSLGPISMRSKKYFVILWFFSHLGRTVYSSHFIILVFQPPLSADDRCIIILLRQNNWADSSLRNLDRTKGQTVFQMRHPANITADFLLGSAKPWFSSSSGASGWWPPNAPWAALLFW